MVLLASLRSNIPRQGIQLSRTAIQIRIQVRPQSTSAALKDGERYWSHIPRYKDISADKFINYQWQKSKIVTTLKLSKLLQEVLPETLVPSKNSQFKHIQTKEQFINEVYAGLKMAPMAIRLTPHVISRIDWSNPMDDPIRRQFIPVKSGFIPDHPQLTLDSLNEQADSPVDGLVHRYPGRALFLPISVCPVYCRYCTRSWAVGADTETVQKCSQKPGKDRWSTTLEYIEKDESIEDIVVSGGDSYQLEPEHIRLIGERLLAIPHIRRFRIASKGIAVAPGRILDATDPWIDEIVALSKKGREMGKQVCIHTHFNHPKEITWITRKAANYLFAQGVIVRNQSVLLRGINDDVETMSTLIKELANINIQPYYVYQCDLVRGIEDLRTPLRTILELEKTIRGTLTGFMMPSFVVDLPGGGGKRLAHTHEGYDEENGLSYWRAPGLPGDKAKQVYTYYDPYPERLTGAVAEGQGQEGKVWDVKAVHERQQRLVNEKVKEIKAKYGIVDKLEMQEIPVAAVEEVEEEQEVKQAAAASG